MNQEHIGKFILKCRNEKNLTQQELADKIGVTDKAISKWENGRGMPDYSLFKPLCEALDINVLELLNGKKEVKLKKEEEQSIINYIDYSKKKSKKTNIFIIIISILLITFILSTVVYFFNTYNKIIVYSLYGESENFIYNDGVLTESNMYNIYSIGKIIPYNINKNIQIIEVTVKCEDELIFYNAYQNTIIEESGYNEIFSNHKFNNLDKWILEITYLEDNEEKTEEMDIKYRILMRNNEFITKKSNSIGNESDEPRIYKNQIEKEDEFYKESNLEDIMNKLNYKKCPTKNKCHIQDKYDESYQQTINSQETITTVFNRVGEVANIFYNYKENEDNYYDIEHILYSKNKYDDYLISFNITGKYNNEEFEVYYNIKKDHISIIKGEAPSNILEKCHNFIEYCNQIKELGFM